MISVVGAGPVGCMAARYCSRSYDTVLFESRRERRIQCAGLISMSGLKRLGVTVSPSDSFLLNRVRGAKIFSPSGFMLEVDGGKGKALVVDRKEFDDFLLSEALDSGVGFVNERVDEKNIKELVKKSDKVVVASGTNYGLHRILGLEKPRVFLTGAQYELKIECDSDFVELYLNVPGGFSWIIPVDGYARVGVCTVGNPVPHLDSFIRRLGADGRVLNKKILGRAYGIIPLYEPGLKTRYDGIVVVGDAAAQVKATTGGGVVMGCIAAGFVCEEDYERRWRSEIGRELYLHLLMKRFLSRLSGRNLDKLFLLLNENRDVFEREGDMDFASKLLYGFLKKPGFMAKFLLQTPGYLCDML